MRIAFAGTPAVAVPALEALLASRHEVCAVITRPDAARGRGRKVAASPVGAIAADSGIPVLAPERAGDPAFLEALAALEPACCPVVAYGALLPPSALAVPPHGWVNLHFSLLPRWRGAAPVQHAILAGDAVTGACVFRIEEGLDTGPVAASFPVPIRADDTAGSLLDRLAHEGAGVLVAVMDAIEDGTARWAPQDDAGATMAPKLGAEDGRVDWFAPAEEVDRRIRAVTPAPGAWAMAAGQRVKLGPVRVLDEHGLAPGAVAIGKHSVRAGTATADIELGTVQAPGKAAMPAADWARGLRAPLDALG